MVESTEPKKSTPAEEASKRNWADEEDDGEDGDDVEIGGTSVAQVGKPKAGAENKGEANETEFAESQPERTFMPKKPR
jgi:hypothetical protein